MAIPTTPTQVANHSGVNAAVAVGIGSYLAIALYQGNLGALATQARGDFLGQNGERGFWQWALAVIILVALGKSPTLKPVFGPLMVVALVAMLINLATTDKTKFANLQDGIKALFTARTDQQAAAPTGPAPANPATAPAQPTGGTGGTGGASGIMGKLGGMMGGSSGGGASGGGMGGMLGGLLGGTTNTGSGTNSGAVDPSIT